MPHIHELYDFVISAFIVHNDKVLLVNHPRYGKWLCPGGHIELDEDPEEALFREIKEETGLKVEILGSKPKVKLEGSKLIMLPRYVDVHEANPPHKHISFIYYARADSAGFIKCDEHTEARWFSELDLEDAVYKLSDAVKFYAHEAIKAAS